MINIRKLETELWEAADLLRADSKVTSQEYCMPVLGLIFLRYAYSRFKFVEADILKNRPMRGGRVLPVEADDFKTKSAIFLPEQARYDYLLNLPDDEDMGKAINNAMELIEGQSSQLKGILPKNYTMFKNDLLRELLRIFNNSAFNEMKDDVIGRIYEYFLNKFAPAVASDDGVFFTPKSLVRMIVNIIEPSRGTVLDPACGSGGMFVSSADFIEQYGVNANTAMTFYGQEKVEYNAKLCVMNMAVHGLDAKIVSGDGANSFYNDAHNLVGSCDYVMANPPFNVDKVKSETALNAGRLPFGLPSVNKNKEIGNANYLWISYFYAYLNEKGRAGFVMASSATDSQSKDRDIREQLVNTGAVDVMISVGNNFFYTKSLSCSLWFFDKAKKEENKDKILFIDARNYYTAVDRTLNEWSEWQMKNLNAIVWLYRGETDKYKSLLSDYLHAIDEAKKAICDCVQYLYNELPANFAVVLKENTEKLKEYSVTLNNIDESLELFKKFRNTSNNSESSTIEHCSKMSKDDMKKLAQSFGKKSYREYEKSIEISAALTAGKISEAESIINELNWLTDKFGNGEYKDILGLCKLATIEEIEEKNYSLTPGAYVGVAEAEDDGVDFNERMKEIHKELIKLQAESNDLMDSISRNLEELGL